MCACSLIDLKAYLNYLKNGSWDGRATTQKMVVGIKWASTVVHTRVQLFIHEYSCSYNECNCSYTSAIVHTRVQLFVHEYSCSYMSAVVPT